MENVKPRVSLKFKTQTKIFAQKCIHFILFLICLFKNLVTILIAYLRCAVHAYFQVVAFSPSTAMSNCLSSQLCSFLVFYLFFCRHRVLVIVSYFLLRQVVATIRFRKLMEFYCIFFRHSFMHKAKNTLVVMRTYACSAELGLLRIRLDFMILSRKISMTCG